MSSWDRLESMAAPESPGQEDPYAVLQPRQSLPSNGAGIDHAERLIGKRAEAHLLGSVGALLVGFGIKKIRLAGGALLPGAPADLDLFPNPDHHGAFVGAVRKQTGAAKLATIPILGHPDVQLINFLVPQLKDLVESFDFAHCKVGVNLRFVRDAWETECVYMSPDFVAARLGGGTFYTGGGGPLRSLARTAKIGASLGLGRDEIYALANQVVDHIRKVGLDEAAKAGNF